MIGNDGKYEQMVDTLPAIPEGKGRLFVYMKGGGATIFNTLGIVGEALSIDDIVYFASGKTFFYVDLDAGTHFMTNNRLIKGFFARLLTYGKSRTDFELANQEVKYIRLDYKGFVMFPRWLWYCPTFESKEKAEKEMRRLKFYTDHNCGMFSGEIWKIGQSLNG